MDARLDVGNLADTTSNDDLRQLFTQAGEVALVCVLRQKYGYGQVQAEIEINDWLRDHAPLR